MTAVAAGGLKIQFEAYIGMGLECMVIPEILVVITGILYH